MVLSRNKIYTVLFSACIAGYIWLYYGITTLQTESNSIEVCLIKHVTNIPCPSCGSTRSMISLAQGNIIKSLYINPFGLIIAFIMISAPIWILFDLVTKKSTLFIFYQRLETHLRKPKIAIPLVLLVLINWIWNITKGL